MSESESDDLNWPKGACAACHQFKTPEGHDPCIANLPGVLFACCGHGNEEGYIKFEDGRSIRFQLNEVDLDLPTVRHKGIPVYQLGGRRIFDFKTKKIKLDRYNTRIIRTKTRQTP